MSVSTGFLNHGGLYMVSRSNKYYLGFILGVTLMTLPLSRTFAGMIEDLDAADQITAENDPEARVENPNGEIVLTVDDGSQVVFTPDDESLAALQSEQQREELQANLSELCPTCGDEMADSDSDALQEALDAAQSGDLDFAAKKKHKRRGKYSNRGIVKGKGTYGFKGCKTITGKTSFYGHGEKLNKRDARGKVFNPNGLSVAHRTLPLGAHITAMRGGKSVEVVIKDRGPAIETGRQFDVSYGTAKALGMVKAGVATVSFRVCNGQG
jgi:rare lipoprotein A